MKKIMMLPCVLNSCAKWSGARKPGLLIAAACCIRISTASISARAEHHEGQHDVHDADFLVIEAGEPFGPEIAPLAEPSDQHDDDDGAEDDDRGGAGADDLAGGGIFPGADERQRVPDEAAEHRGPDALGHDRGSRDWTRMRWNRSRGTDEKSDRLRRRRLFEELGIGRRVERMSRTRARAPPSGHSRRAAARRRRISRSGSRIR